MSFSALRGALAVSLVAAVLAGTAIAGPLEDANAAYNRGDYATSLLLLLPLAHKGNALAQTNLGVMYRAGQGVPQDYAEAMKWYRKAADQGHDGAENNLGTMYYIGKGVPKDYVQVIKWLDLAASRYDRLRASHLFHA